MMPDLIVAASIFGFLLALAVVAPIWGHDSRDGIESDQYARRAPWLYDRETRSRTALLAGTLSGSTGRRTAASVHVWHRHQHDDAELCAVSLLCIPAA